MLPQPRVQKANNWKSIFAFLSIYYSAILPTAHFNRAFGIIQLSISSHASLSLETRFNFCESAAVTSQSPLNLNLHYFSNLLSRYASSCSSQLWSALFHLFEILVPSPVFATSSKLFKNYGQICMRAVERVQQRELCPIIFQKVIIKILKLYLQTASLEWVILLVLNPFLRIQHRMKRLQVVLPFWIVSVEVCGRLRLESYRTGLVESGLCGLGRFDWVEAEPVLRILWGKGVFSNRAIPNRAIGWLLPDCLKHNNKFIKLKKWWSAYEDR